MKGVCSGLTLAVAVLLSAWSFTTFAAPAVQDDVSVAAAAAPAPVTLNDALDTTAKMARPGNARGSANGLSAPAGARVRNNEVAPEVAQERIGPKTAARREAVRIGRLILIPLAGVLVLAAIIAWLVRTLTESKSQPGGDNSDKDDQRRGSPEN